MTVKASEKALQTCFSLTITSRCDFFPTTFELPVSYCEKKLELTVIIEYTLPIILVDTLAHMNLGNSEKGYRVWTSFPLYVGKDDLQYHKCGSDWVNSTCIRSIFKINF